VIPFTYPFALVVLLTLASCFTLTPLAPVSSTWRRSGGDTEEGSGSVVRAVADSQLSPALAVSPPRRQYSLDAEVVFNSLTDIFCYFRRYLSGFFRGHWILEDPSHGYWSVNGIMFYPWRDVWSYSATYLWTTGVPKYALPRSLSYLNNLISITRNKNTECCSVYWSNDHAVTTNTTQIRPAAGIVNFRCLLPPSVKRINHEVVHHTNYTSTCIFRSSKLPDWIWAAAIPRSS